MEKNRENLTLDLSSYEFGPIANKSANKTEFMSSIGLIDSRRKVGEFKEVNETSDRKLSKTGIIF